MPAMLAARTLSMLLYREYFIANSMFARFLATRVAAMLFRC